MEDSLAVSQKIKYRVTIRPIISLLGICPREMKTYGHSRTWTQTFVVVLLITGNSWKQPKYPSTDEQISEMWYSYIIEYYLAIKRKDIQIHATKWMNLENRLNKRPHVKGYILYGSTYMKYPGQTNL